MPNPDLDEVLLDTVTRRRITQAVVGGQTRKLHQDLAGIRASVRPAGAAARNRGYGMVPEADFLVTLDPDSDVMGPDQASGTHDVLIVTGGSYTGVVVDCGFVHHRHHVEHRKAECTRLAAVPVSAPVP